MPSDLELYSVNVESGRRITRILVIDDEEFLLAEPLRRSGFLITHVKDIQSIDEVEPYQIIACDIHGVGRAFSSVTEGAFLIQQIKVSKPEKYVLAFSRGAFNLSYQAALKSADWAIEKDADVAIWAHDLDTGIRKTWSPHEIWLRTTSKLVALKISPIKIAELEKKFAESIRLRQPLTDKDVVNALTSRNFLEMFSRNNVVAIDLVKATNALVSFGANAATLLAALNPPT